MADTLTSRRRADRGAMAAQVAALAGEYGLTAVHFAEQPGMRRTSVSLEAAHGLRLIVKFDATLHAPDTYVLNWHGVDEGTRLHPGMFGVVNSAHGHKATDVARGFAQLTRILKERFAVIADGSAFVTDARPTAKTRAVVELELDDSGLTIERRWVYADGCPVWRGYNPDPNDPAQAAHVAGEASFCVEHGPHDARPEGGPDRCGCGGLFCGCGAHYPAEFLAELPHRERAS
jgi:hypothetical protein